MWYEKCEVRLYIFWWSICEVRSVKFCVKRELNFWKNALLGLIFRKIEFTFHAKCHISHFTYHSSKNVFFHFTFLISHLMFKIYNFSFTFIFCILLLIFCTVKCDLWSGKCEMRITNHNSQMANVISETNMKREFSFWKNALLDGQNQPFFMSESW